ncbi:MAG TPA: lipoate--protein ligase family protein [Anaerolineales bacterium]|nr:lipoate--protein ligase family protein [Anaerolineales bacterium]
MQKFPLWRVIFSGTASGAENMAIDSAILQAIATHQSPPTLRLYAWEPACLSLGVSQLSHEAHLEEIAKNGWQIVRRPSGGRAILHTRELTYALLASETDPVMDGGIIASYRRISQGLLTALEAMGVAASNEGTVPEGAHKQLPVCFEVPSDYEIVANGKKLIGSAQVRKQGVVLQHGSLPLYGDIGEICSALRFEHEIERAETAVRVRQRATTLEAVLGYTPTWQATAEQVQAGLAHALDVQFELGALNAYEEELAQTLRVEKFGNPEYTFRR